MCCVTMCCVSVLFFVMLCCVMLCTAALPVVMKPSLREDQARTWLCFSVSVSFCFCKCWLSHFLNSSNSNKCLFNPISLCSETSQCVVRILEPCTSQEDILKICTTEHDLCFCDNNPFVGLVVTVTFPWEIISKEASEKKKTQQLLIQSLNFQCLV